MEVFVKPYKDIIQKEKADILSMLSQIWTDFNDESEIHHNNLTVQSFYIYHHEKVIAIQELFYKRLVIIIES